MRTLFRAVVMIAAGVIIVKGWQLYGPETDEVKAIARRALAAAQEALGDGTADNGDGSGATLAADPRLAPPPVAPAAPSEAPAAPPLAELNPITPIGATEPPAAVDSTADVPVESTDQSRVAVLLARLEELGAADPQLTPWGSSGQMYRFCCRAALAESPEHARHFEAMAAEPEAAVEQVVAKIESWRTAQRDSVLLR